MEHATPQDMAERAEGWIIQRRDGSFYTGEHFSANRAEAQVYTKMHADAICGLCKNSAVVPLVEPSVTQLGLEMERNAARITTENARHIKNPQGQYLTGATRSGWTYDRGIAMIYNRPEAELRCQAIGEAYNIPGCVTVQAYPTDPHQTKIEGQRDQNQDFTALMESMKRLQGEWYGADSAIECIVPNDGNPSGSKTTLGYMVDALAMDPDAMEMLVRLVERQAEANGRRF